MIRDETTLVDLNITLKLGAEVNEIDKNHLKTIKSSPNSHNL